jgi:phosphoribosylaminoimidazole-succinocarboxamide synthase
MNNTTSQLIATNFFLKNQKSFHRGKVRDIYNIKDKYLVIVACDRISAFDHVLPSPIPYKGQILNQIAAKFLDATAHDVPNWKIATPDPNVTVGIKCDPIMIEFVIRGYLAGYAWRVYEKGGREVCGVTLPDGLKKNDRLPEPIITPTIKNNSGHDTDISMADILTQKLLRKKDLEQLEAYTKKLYSLGTNIADERGLILVDTKYEFGFNEEKKIMLIDEVHTPDSSRYFYKADYEKHQKKGEEQKQLSKEFVREWLMANGFYGEKDQKIPDMTEEVVNSITDRYVELYEKITGEKFVKRSYDNISDQIENNVNEYINSNPLFV